MAKSKRKSIPIQVKLFLWAKSAGRCNLCNKNIYEDYHTFSEVNVGDHAHIIGSSSNGPRGDKLLSEKLAVDPCNLILLCREHHKLVDTSEFVEKYPAEKLLQIKRDHEDRVEFITSIGVANKSYVLLYGANIGKLNNPVNFEDASRAMFVSNTYPAERIPTIINLAGSAFTDDTEKFWEIERENLHSYFASLIKARLSRGDIHHLSVFALAPIPLLIELGILLTDKTRASIYQLHREPPGWAWLENEIDSNFKYIFELPNDTDKKSVALVISFSGRIADVDITDTLGDDVAIWHLTIDQPANDFLKKETQLAKFRQELRKVFDIIKHTHGKNAVIHIFPAVPVAIAIEVGRVWMPKADLPFVIYDRNREHLKFIRAFQVG